MVSSRVLIAYLHRNSSENPATQIRDYFLVSLTERAEEMRREGGLGERKKSPEFSVFLIGPSRLRLCP